MGTDRDAVSVTFDSADVDRFTTRFTGRTDRIAVALWSAALVMLTVALVGLWIVTG